MFREKKSSRSADRVPRGRNDMRKVKRLLASILVVSLLIGSNGISYAAEAANLETATGTEETVNEISSEDTGESSAESWDLISWT